MSSALRSHWLIALVPVVVLGLAALLAGLLRSPEYTAKTRLAIGRLVPSDALVLADSTFSASMAETYSRSIQANAVVRPTARRLGVDPGWVRAGLSAAPIPLTQVLTVSFAASSPDDAVKASNIAAHQLKRYVGRLRVSTDASNKLAAYRRAVERELNLEATSSSASDPQAQAELEAAKLVTESAAQRYRNTKQGQIGVTDLRIIEPATSASSDRYSVLQILLLVGLAAGTAVGTALAVAQARRRESGTPGLVR